MIMQCACFAMECSGMVQCHAGIYLAPSSFEAGFTSMAHSEEDVDRTIAAAREVMKEI